MSLYIMYDILKPLVFLKIWRRWPLTGRDFYDFILKMTYFFLGILGLKFLLKKYILTIAEL